MRAHHEHAGRISRLQLALAIASLSCVIAAPARAHPGSGIVVDRQGQVYFIDTGAGVWKIDLQGNLSRIGGPFFHWMAIDLDDRFANVRLPSGSGGDVVRVGASPTLLVSSDFPIAIGRDGNLYYPSRGSRGAIEIMKLTPTGQTSKFASLPANGANGQPLRHLNGLTAAPDGSLYFTEDNAVRRITSQGEISTVVSALHLARCASIPGMTAKDNPLLRGLDVDTAGTVHVAASACGSVITVARDGRVSTIAQVEGPWSPTAVAVFGGDTYALEYLHTETENSGSRREWVPRVRKIPRRGASAIIANVTRG